MQFLNCKITLSFSNQKIKDRSETLINKGKYEVKIKFIVSLIIEHREIYGTSYDYAPDDENNLWEKKFILLKHDLTLGETYDMELDELLNHNPYTNLIEMFQCQSRPSAIQLKTYNELLDSIADYISDFTCKRIFRKATLSIEDVNGYYYEGGKAIQVATIIDIC